MKATGIVRRIDELGRIVIPKEIRRTFRLKEADSVEIYTGEEGEIILKKYSPIGDMSDIAKQYADTLSSVTGHIVCVTDRDKVIAVSGKDSKKMLGKNISKSMENTIENRDSKMLNYNDKGFVDIINDSKMAKDSYFQEVISTIICEGDAIGAVVIATKENKVKFGDTEQKLADSCASFLGKQLES